MEVNAIKSTLVVDRKDLRIFIVNLLNLLHSRQATELQIQLKTLQALRRVLSVCSSLIKWNFETEDELGVR